MINGVELYYEYTQAGASGGAESRDAAGATLTPGAAGAPCETIVFLNGIAMSVAHWKPLVPAFSGRFNVLCHDFRGQTMSGRPDGPYSLDGHARDLAGLMDLLGIAKAHIVGTSYGSEVAMAFASSMPERTATLAIIDGVSELDPLLSAAVESWRTAALADPSVFYKTILPWTYSSAYLAANGETLRRRGEAVASLPRDWFTAFAALCDAFSAIDLTPRLGRITCPALVMVGERDILKHEGFARIIAAGIRGSRLVTIPGAGHAVTIERPDAVAAELSAFLAGSTPGGQ